MGSQETRRQIRAKTGGWRRGAAVAAALVALGLVSAPYVVARLHAHFLKCGSRAGSAASGSEDCCAVPASSDPEAVAATPQTQPAAPLDPAREVIFEVESLQCPAVKGVGCGSILWPVLTQIDRVDGVTRSFSNWTGTRLRVAIANRSERNAVAERVRQLLASDERHPSLLSATELTQALRDDKWYSAAGLVELSSYEFHTIAKRRLQAFSDTERLDAARRAKLMNLTDQLWDQSGTGIGLPGSEPNAYGQYWRSRLDRFVSEFTGQARQVITAEQAQRLSRMYDRKGGPTAGSDGK